jgi:hypothetical protein
MRTKKKSATMASANCAVKRANLSAMPPVSIPNPIPNTAGYAEMPANLMRSAPAANANPIVCAALPLVMGFA